jgi:hypothetical protein
MKEPLLNELLSRMPPEKLWHYTGQAGFMGIVKNQEIWATHTQYLNDWREYLHAVDLVREQIQLLNASSTELGQLILHDMQSDLAGVESINVCVCSFSEERDSLSQWRAYARGSSGFAVGFAGDFLAEATGMKNWYLAPCIYEIAEQRALVRAFVQEVYEENLGWRTLGSQMLEHSPPGGNLLAYLHRIAPILKNHSFHQEREWRLISRPLSCTSAPFDFREGPSMLIPFYKFPLKDAAGNFRLHEVVVGPTPHPVQSRSSATSFLVRQDLRKFVVSNSEVPYRSW